MERVVAPLLRNNALSGSLHAQEVQVSELQKTLMGMRSMENDVRGVAKRWAAMCVAQERGLQDERVLSGFANYRVFTFACMLPLGCSERDSHHKQDKQKLAHVVPVRRFLVTLRAECGFKLCSDDAKAVFCFA